MYLFDKLKIRKLRNVWRDRNRHNATMLGNVFDMDCVVVGKSSYGTLFVYNDVKNVKLVIGNYCSIASQVKFILGLDHYTNHISTFPFKVKELHVAETEAISKGDIIVEDDVWIGENAMILSGVHIGQGAIIAAGAVVSKDVPAYAIVGGVPAKVIRYRFEPEMIEELLKVDYSKLTKEMIEEHVDELYQKLTDVRQLEWMPRK